MADFEFKNISFSYDDRESVFSNLNLSFQEGKTYAICGPSGKGKTTLFLLAMGILQPDEGKISGFQEKKKAVVFQDNRLFPWMSAFQNVKVVGGSDAKEILLKLGINAEEMKHRPNGLSGGQKRRVAIARALSYGGDVYFLDEPFTGLDEETKKKTIEVVKEATKGKTVFLISHSEEDIRLLDASVIVL